MTNVLAFEVQEETIQLNTLEREDNEELSEVNLMVPPPQHEEDLDKAYETQEVIITLYTTPDREDNFEMLPPLNDEKKYDEKMEDVFILEVNPEKGKSFEARKEIVPE